MISVDHREAERDEEAERDDEAERDQEEAERDGEVERDEEVERETIPVPPSEEDPAPAVHVPPNPIWSPDTVADDAPTPPDGVTDDG